MPIWSIEPSLELLNTTSQNTLVSHLGIVFTEVGQDWLSARMPVDARTHQPLGLLHGGASAALAETLGSVAGSFVVEPKRSYVMGLALNANHVRPVRQGWVLGIARPIHLGRTTQVWQIRIEDEDGQLVSITRLTLIVRDYEMDESGRSPRASWLESDGPGDSMEAET
ncbi:MAG TPA: hotdog fold thioesterase [Anaerolineales bacterium]|jgi:1,4-dihydroxy-2-naphthoyl-CoA hydrolase